jgi:hypothetical protein
MKHFYTIFFLLVTQSLFCQTYYWVGGEGAWSDLAHWATTSGGNTFHTQLPQSTNDVVFDQNSFSAPGQIIFLDMEEAFCKDFNSLSVTNAPTFQGDYYLDQLSIYGNLTLSSNPNYDFKTVNLLQSSGDCLLTSGATFLGGLCFIKLDGGANYHLQDSISAGNIYIYNAKFFSNNNPIHCGSRFRSNFSPGREVHLGSSHLYTPEFLVTNDMLLSAEQSTIHLNNPSQNFGDFEGAGFDYGTIILEGNTSIIGNNNFEEFTVLPGTEVAFTAASTQTSQNFTLIGNAFESVQLTSTEPGNQANLVQSSGIVNGNYLVLQDMNASGGATFNANNTVDLGNNSGWNIIQDVPANYFWVNGPGNWADLGHWATVSGGMTYHVNLPNAQDTVIIDQNSFSESGDLVIDVEAYCAEFLMNNALQGIQIAGYQPLHCYGSLVLAEGTIGNFSQIYTEGENAGNTITTNGANWGNGSAFIFNSEGEWLLEDDLNAGRIEFNKGIFRSQGHSIVLNDQINTYSDAECILDLSNSTVMLQYWRPFNSLCEYILDNSTIVCSNGDFYGLNLDYHDVIFSGETMEINQSFTCNDFEVLPGSALTLESGITVTAESFDLTGTAEEPISIQSSAEGEEAFFQKASGTVDATYLILQDNHAVGGAQFTALNSDFVSNVEGWQLIIGVEEWELEQNLMPNPASDFTKIPAIPGDVYQIFDATGKCITGAQLVVSTNPEIDVKQLNPGLYIIAIHSKTPKSYQLIIN